MGKYQLYSRYGYQGSVEKNRRERTILETTKGKRKWLGHWLHTDFYAKGWIESTVERKEKKKMNTSFGRIKKDKSCIIVWKVKRGMNGQDWTFLVGPAALSTTLVMMKTQLTISSKHNHKYSSLVKLEIPSTSHVLLVRNLWRY